MRRFFLNPQFWHNNFLVYNFFISFTLLLLTWGEIAWALFALRGGTFFSLHYSIYFGVDWLGEANDLFLFSTFATIVLILNYALSNFFYESKRILSYFLTCSTSLIEIIVTVSTGLVIYINWASSTSI